jgi:hypothetical protein
MSETAQGRGAERLLRVYQQQEKRFAERRFPLRFDPEVPASCTARPGGSAGTPRPTSRGAASNPAPIRRPRAKQPG